MKCPKCGFNSFEFHDSCRKCGVSLSSFKKSLGISPIVFSAGQPQPETRQPNPTPVPAEEASLPAAAEIIPQESSGEALSWDMPPMDETAPGADATFSGFDLDFMKDAGNSVEPVTDFSFEDIPVAENSGGRTAESSDSLEEFSFYENTLEPGEVTFPGTEAGEAPRSDPFGESGVLGEILPEQMQTAEHELELTEQVGDNSFDPGAFEPEFDFGGLSEEPESQEKSEKEAKKDPLDFSDFEKDFESIFQTNATDKGGAEN